jgi:drug/metabolite transporter (DMT)-like permease
MLSRSGKKEGIDFKSNVSILLIVMASLMGAVSALYDKYLMASPSEGGLGVDRMLVQSWFNIYQCVMMFVVLLLLWWPKHRQTTPFHWHWSIIGVSLFISLADFMYFYALTIPDALLSVMSMIRRASVVVSFLFGALFFHESNLKAKSFDLLLVLLGMLFLCLGS